MDNGWNEKVSEFFLEYVKPVKDAYTESGNLTFTAINQAAKYLIEQNVFDSVKEMRKQAMQDYEIILPETIFN